MRLPTDIEKTSNTPRKQNPNKGTRAYAEFYNSTRFKLAILLHGQLNSSRS